MFQKTKAYDKICQLKKRIRGVGGGTAASKTISIILWLIDYAQTHENQVISVVSESFPHLKRGAIRDFLNIMETHSYFKPSCWNKTDNIYTFGTTKFEFFSADQPGKVRGPRRDVLFINEANNISYETYTQLEIRTEKIIWLDWNPVAEFWWYVSEDGGPGVKNRPDAEFITLTYKDNESLSEDFIKALEFRKPNNSWWRVYGMGLLGELEGKIYKDWEIIDEIPHQARLWRYGLDFGYTNDPAAAVAVYQYEGGYILDEVLYHKRLSNQQIADMFKNIDRALIIADSAEPKSIDEIRRQGLMIISSEKGKDSVLHGIQYVQEQRISVTKKSLNLIKEYRNYLWMKDKQERVINEPSDIFSHLMDACRYAIASGKKIEWKPNNPGGINPFFEGMPG